MGSVTPTIFDAIRVVENCEYENVAVHVILQRLKALSSCVSVSDSARRAAEEVCAYFGDTELAMGGHVNANGVAAIISKHFAAAQPAAMAGRVVNISTHGEPTRARLREVETSVSNGYERECREIGWSKSLQSALRDLRFLLTFFQDDVANDAAPADNDAESLLQHVAYSGVEFDDNRMGYVVVQIDCDVWEQLQARKEDR